MSAGDRPRTGPGRLTGGRRSSSSGQGGRQVPRPPQPHPHPRQPPKPFPPKAAFPAGRTRHVRPPAPERTLHGVTLPQLRRQQDARRVIRGRADSVQAGQGAGHRSAEREAGGDRGSAQ